MIEQARFTYTDGDMTATQRAGWMWSARWRNLLAAYVVIALFESAMLAGLNAAYGTRGAPTDLVFVIGGSAVLTILLFGLISASAWTHGRVVLRGTSRRAWDGDDLGGEHAWGWDGNGLRVRSERTTADLSWAAVGAWLDAPEVLLLFPAGGRAFTLPEPTLAAGWRQAPKVFLLPFGGYALALPKRALTAEDAGRLVDMLRAEGVQERRRFGLIAAQRRRSDRDPNMGDDASRDGMPLSMVATQGVGLVLLLAGLTVMFMSDSVTRSGTRLLFEALMLSGAACCLMFAFRYWRWRKACRSRQPRSRTANQSSRPR